MSDYMQLFAPYDRRLLAEIPLDDWKTAEKYLEDAANLHAAKNPLPIHKRIAILENLVATIQREKDNLAYTATEEGGKPWNDTIVEINRAIQGIKYAIAALSTMGGSEIPMGLTPSAEGKFAVTFREPIGPILAISAFNHPINLIIHQIIPAVAAGCPIIVKPALTTPRSCLRIVELLRESGLPEEWCRAIVCENDITARMSSDSRLAFMNFIGSERVGWTLRAGLAPGVRCSLEHGGAAPVIIDETADIAIIAPLLAKGGFYHAGQVCVSVQRVFALRNSAAELAEAIAQAGNSFIVGDPLSPQTDVGPLITLDARQRVSKWIDDGVVSGGAIIGKEMNNVHKLPETCLAPIVIFNPSEDARISREEIFGPAIAVYSCNTMEEAVSRANNVRYEFQAAVFTENLRFAFDASKNLKATSVIINDHSAFRVDWMPFGGRGVSGQGTGGIGYTLHDYTQEKLLVFSM